MLKNSRDEGFTFTELLISMAITLVVTGAALTTFQNALMVNDSAAQLADANQNLRAGTNQLIKDVMQAGRIIGPEGIPVPTGAGVTAIARPGPPGQSLTFNVTTSSDLTTNIPDITTGYMLGPVVINQATDMITLLTVDAFMPAIETTDPMGTGAFDPNEGTIDPAGAFVTLPATSLWLLGDRERHTAGSGRRFGPVQEFSGLSDSDRDENGHDPPLLRRKRLFSLQSAQRPSGFGDADQGHREHNDPLDRTDDAVPGGDGHLLRGQHHDSQDVHGWCDRSITSPRRRSPAWSKIWT